MIPILGDGSGIIKELYSLHTTGEMDELNFTLSVIGLAMDSPLDAGFVGDTVVATLKAFSVMIPAGPARDVLLNAIRQVIKNPDEIGDFADTAKILMNNSELLDALVENPKALGAAFEAGPEAVEQLAKQGDAAIQMVKGLDEGTLKTAMEGSDDALKSADEAAKILTDGSHLITDSKGKVVGLKPDVTYNAGEFDYIYKTDDMGRLSQADVTDLKLSNTPRVAHNPNTPGKVIGQDHAGHLIADRFGGSPEIDNLISQLSGDNLSGYRILENKWANAIDNGQLVEVKIDLVYTGTEVRPTQYIVEYKIDGDPIKRVFNN